MKTKESNEAFVERIVNEIDAWQDGNKRNRVALLIMQDETGKTAIHAFGNNRGKNPEIRFVGRMIGIVAHRKWLFEVVLMVAKLSCKMRNREAKHGANQ